MLVQAVTLLMLTLLQAPSIKPALLRVLWPVTLALFERRQAVMLERFLVLKIRIFLLLALLRVYPCTMERLPRLLILLEAAQDKVNVKLILGIQHHHLAMLSRVK
jgi:hypothetical protein